MTEAEWEEYLDTRYAQWVAEHEAYAYEDNYEPFENKALPTEVSQASIKYIPKQVNRS